MIACTAEDSNGRGFQTMVRNISENVFIYEDACQVYIVRNKNQGILIDYGTGAVQQELPKLGIQEIKAVLLTHHHRDQLQGLAGAKTSFPVFVPHAERELIGEADIMWQRREILNNYNCRQDRFSTLTNVPVTGTLEDYGTYAFAGIEVKVWPTPGHTTGSVTLEIGIDGKKMAFTGDLIFGRGKVYSLAATQWSYNGGEGIPHTVLSLLFLQEQKYDRLLPSHGEPMCPDEAIPETVENLAALMKLRRQNPRCFQLRERPYEHITEHLLFNRTSMSDSYVLVSESGKALIFDLGYDFMAGVAAGCDRSSRRPWLYTLPWLFENCGVTSIDACIATHYHDDHVAGFPLLRRRYGTKVLCAENFADIISHPSDYDLPCLWYDPIPVDQVIPLEETFCWEEYELTLHTMSGHTEYAVAISFAVDGKKVLCAGDQYADGDSLFLNYVYKNHFSYEDFIHSAELYKRLSPDIILTGHWQYKACGEEYYQELMERGKELAKLHEKLLPDSAVNFDSDQRIAVCYPYHIMAEPNSVQKLTVEVVNPYREEGEMELTLILPKQVKAVKEQKISMLLQPGETKRAMFELKLGNEKVRRARIGVELSVNGKRKGQITEALVSCK